MRRLLEFEDVTLERGGRLLFEELDLAMGAGDALHVAGPNGSGKSSLIRAAAGLLRPKKGRVQASALALADERLAMDRELTVKSALDFWTPLSGSCLHDAMEALGLTGLADVPLRLLSTGQLKRVTLARVAASDAPLWLLDEPLNGLDAEGVGGLAALIDCHRAVGGTVLAASHVTLPGAWQRLELGR